MNVDELYARLGELIAAGHGEELVFMDTGPDILYTIADVDLDVDDNGVILWKE